MIKRRAARVEQVPTRSTSVSAVMKHPHFQLGVDDVRMGRPFDCWCTDGLWAYDRGRLFGAIAPLKMPLFVDRCGRRALNPKAVELYVAARNRGYIT
jgi:hypothetical protein